MIKKKHSQPNYNGIFYRKTAIWYFVFILFLSSKIFSQCYTTNTAFQFGENISYEVYYNWGFIWLNAGNVYFRVDKAQNQNNVLYHFNSAGNTYKEYDWFFKVRDRYETYVDSAEFKPLQFFRSTSEGGYAVNNKYFFNYSENHIFTITENSDKPLSYDTLNLPKCTFDVLTTIYYARNIDYSQYEINDKIPLSIIIDNELFDLYIKYLGKENYTLRDGITTYRCIKFKPLLVEGTIFSGGENMTVWVTDDKNKIPVMVEAKILIGSIKAIVINMEGLRHEVKAEIK
ncbi:MAG: DUF3108 domain-containing protein [Chlorobi bacterium]|nr:DUF3108 domain-containing protein [Chlorobiota bacterium]